MTGGGPFRDTLRPMIADARVRLGERQMRHAEARAALDRMIESKERVRTLDLPFSMRSFVIGLVVGAAVGVPVWLTFMLLRVAR